MMKSYVWLQTADGSIQEVEQEVAKSCPMICHEIQSGVGTSKNHPISLPPKVTPAMFSLIFDYCRFHQAPGRSNKERKSYDEKLVRMDTKRLCALTSAADSLQLKTLVDLMSRTLARNIEGRAPEEVREMFNLSDDLTEEEKLEPLHNISDDPRIRLLNRLNAKKLKEIKEKEKLKNVVAEKVKREDARSVDELLSFINGGEEDSKGVRASKSKKKTRKRKEQQKKAPSSSASNGTLSNNAIEVHNKDPNGSDAACDSVKGGPNGFLSTFTFPPEDEFDEGDVDDEIDPALKEKIDREVEDFARRLNSDWPKRMQEILSVGPERRPNPISVNGNGSLRKYTNPRIFTHV